MLGINRQTERPLPFWQARPLVLWAVFFGAGILMGTLCQPNALLYVAAGISLLTFLLGVYWKKPWPLMLCVPMLFMGMLWGSTGANPKRPVEGTYTIQAQVEGKSLVRETGQVVCTLKNVTLMETGEMIGKCYWTYYLDGDKIDPGYRDGDYVSFQGNLYHPQGQANPNGFNFEKYLRQKGISCGLYGFIDGATEKGKPSLAFSIRENLSKRLQDTIGEESGLAIALLLGERDLLDEETTISFRRCGIAHILCVSGLHISIIAGFVVAVLRKLQAGAKLKFAAIAIFLFGYAWLIGFSATVMRAAIISLFTIGQRVVRRRSDPMTSLAAAFLVILTLHPMDLLSPGFVLSFTAVGGILLIGDALENSPLLRRVQKLPGLGSIHTSLGAQVGTLLPVMAYYQELPVFGMLFNLVAIPYTTGLMGVYILTLIGSFIGPVGMWIGQLAALMTKALTASAAWLGQFPFVVVQTGAPALLTILAGFAAIWIASRFVKCSVKLKCSLLACCLMVAIFATAADQHTQLRYTQFSLGQADGAVIEDGKSTIVIDAGERGNDIAAYLRAENRKIDVLIITHLHSDHIGGIKDLIDKNVSIGVCYIPEGGEDALPGEYCLELLQALRDGGTPVKTLARGDTLTFPRATITVTWPERDKVRPNQDANQSSLCLRIEGEGVSILTTGDIIKGYEMYAALPADILKVAHHGSATGTTSEFLEAVNPKLALVTCKEGGNLPSKRVMEALENAAIPIMRTDEAGAIIIQMIDGKATASAYLQKEHAQ